MLRAVYFLVGAITAAVTVFLPPYLRGLGLGGKQVASIMSLPPALQLGAPLVWAWLADHTQRHARVLALILGGAAVGFLPVAFTQRYPGLLAAFVVYAFFWAGTTSMQDAVTLGRLRAQPTLHYGSVRSFGSVGFLLTAIVVGALLTWRGSRGADALVPTLAATLLVLAALASMTLGGEGERAARPHLADVRGLLRDPVFRRLLVLAPLHWGAAAPYNQFFGLYARDRHLSPLALGVAFAVGVLAEVIVFLRFPRLRERWSLRRLMGIAFAGTLLRWVAIALAENSALLVALQVFHGLTYGLFWATSIACLQATVAPRLRATGQALFVMAMSGVGTLAGSYATGALYDATGSLVPAFAGAALVEAVALALLCLPGGRLDVAVTVVGEARAA